MPTRTSPEAHQASSLLEELLGAIHPSEDLAALCRVFLEVLARKFGLELAALWFAPTRLDTTASGDLRLGPAVPSAQGVPSRIPIREYIAVPEAGATVEASGEVQRPGCGIPGDLWLRVGKRGLLLARPRRVGASPVNLDSQDVSFALVRFGQAIDCALTIYELRRELKDLTTVSVRSHAVSARLAALVSSLGNAVLVENEHRVVEIANRPFCDLFKVPAEPEQLHGIDCAVAAQQSSGLFSEPLRFLARTQEIVASRQPVDHESWEMASGTFVERDYRPIFDGEIFRGHLWLYRDVTERRKADREIAHLKNFYEQVLDALPIQLAIFDRSLRYLYATLSAISDPATRKWIIGKTDRQFCARRGLDPAVASRRSASLEQCIADSRLVSFEESFPNRLGLERHFLRIVSPIFDEAGEVVQVLGFGLDITDRKHAESALQASEAKLRAIHDAAIDALVTIDEHGKIVDFNPGAVRIFGWDPAEALGKDIADLLVPPQHREAHRRGMNRFRETGEGPILGRRLEMTALRADGTEFPCELTVMAIRTARGETLFTSMLRDITEAKLAEAQLVEAKQEAERAAFARQQFLANMSHEIRTPLNAVVGMTHLLATSRDERERDGFLTAIRESAETLFALISDILDLSKIEAGRIEFERLVFRPGEVVRAIVESMRGAAAGKRLDLTCTVAPQVPPEAVGDAARLRQILVNLVGNAIKFTEKGSVSVSLDLARSEARGNALAIEVRDTGIGISEEGQRRIFDPFTQENAATRRRFGGTGLGLAIVRQLVERQEGSVSLVSAPGLGSCFRVELPFLPAEVAPRAAGASFVTTHDEEDLAGVRILLVEDNELNQVVASRLLEAAGAHVTIAPNGEDALLRLGDQRFDLVLMDLRMPGLDGFETTRRLRQSLGFSSDQLPVVALTASALLEERDRALAVGIDDFVLKPFDPADLRRRIGALTRKRGAGAGPTGPSVQTERALVDYGQLEAQTLGQRDFALQLIDLFQAQSRQFPGDLASALRSGDRDRVRALAHRFKSSAAVVGALLLSARLAELEDRALEPGSDEDLAPLAAAVSDLIAEVTEELGRGRARFAEGT